MSSALTGKPPLGNERHGHVPLAAASAASSLGSALKREREDAAAAPGNFGHFGSFNSAGNPGNSNTANNSSANNAGANKRSLALAAPSPALGPSSGHSFRRAKALLDNMARSLSSQHSGSFAQSPIFGPGGSTTQLAMSLSRSLGKSWTRDAFLDTLAMHLDPKSPFMAPSPQRDLQQFAMLEDKFCKDFTCCGIPLDSMHDLLQHYEEYHVRVESDYGDDIEYDDDDDVDQHESDDDEHFPFGLDSMEEDDIMDMDEFDVLSAQQQQEANTAFLRAQIAAMSTNTPTAVNNSLFGFANPQFQPQQPVIRATISSMLGTPGQHPPTNTSSFSQIQKHDNQVDDFRILRSQSEQNPPVTAAAAVPTSGFSAFNDTIIRGKRHGSNIVGGSASGASTPTRSSTFPGTSIPTTGASGLNIGKDATPVASQQKQQQQRRKKTESSNFDAPELLPFCESTPTRFVAYNDDDDESEISDIDYDDLELISGSMGDEVGQYGELNGSSSSPVSEATTTPTAANATSPAGAAASGAAAAAEDRPFKCKVEGCGKEYKNPNGLKYHMRNGHAEDTGDPEVNNMIQRPYGCVVGDCGKRYKNLNGLKYHIQHAHSELLQAAAEPDFGSM
ncbi:hypothetical protein BDR26DRAFT_851331 [Obelidium mucronatum]|nr:hypothetical protein BDR26DRAFT_851331 [Obelidium mucronatum]